MLITDIPISADNTPSHDENFGGSSRGHKMSELFLECSSRKPGACGKAGLLAQAHVREAYAHQSLTDSIERPNLRKRRRMGRRSGGHDTDSEFPLLGNLMLYASPTTGDGNCLFRALSDQLYGNESQYGSLRRDAVAYIRANKDRFIGFVGGFGETFEQYTKRMSQDGVYGGHLELAALADVLTVEVAIYQADYMYIVHPHSQKTVGRVHIAYHTWEHYSSVRNKEGPHSGLPSVEPRTQNGGPYDELTVGNGRDGDDVPSWKVDIVLRSVPHAEVNRARELLRLKDIGEVIEELLMQELDPEEDAASKDSVGELEETVMNASAPYSSPSQIVQPKQETVTSNPLTRDNVHSEKRQARFEKRQARLEQRQVRRNSHRRAQPNEQSETNRRALKKKKKSREQDLSGRDPVSTATPEERPSDESQAITGVKVIHI